MESREEQWAREREEATTTVNLIKYLELKADVQRLTAELATRDEQLKALVEAADDVVNETWQSNEHEQCYFDNLKSALERAREVVG